MKYDVTFSCGHTGVVELFGKGAERERKLEWYAGSGVCKECYKAAQAAQLAATPITVTVAIAPRVDDETGDFIFSVSLAGNTLPRKDEIKAAGFHWTTVDSIADTFSYKAPKKFWCKEVREDEIESTVMLAVNQFGATLSRPVSNLWATMDAEMARRDRVAWENKKALMEARKAAVAAVKKPVCPSIIKGKRWNGNIYGKQGSFVVYLGGVKTAITDEQAVKLEKWCVEKAAYDKAVAEIEKQYR